MIAKRILSGANVKLTRGERLQLRKEKAHALKESALKNVVRKGSGARQREVSGRARQGLYSSHARRKIELDAGRGDAAGTGAVSPAKVRPAKNTASRSHTAATAKARKAARKAGAHAGKA